MDENIINLIRSFAKKLKENNIESLSIPDIMIIDQLIANLLKKTYVCCASILLFYFDSGGFKMRDDYLVNKKVIDIWKKFYLLEKAA